MTSDQLWQATLAELELNLSKANFTTWFKNTFILEYENNKVIIYNDDHPQGMVVEELYLDENTAGSIMQTLGPDQYFVMGDNRDSSYDSRRFGPINKEALVGKTLFRGWPFTRINKFPTPEYNF